MKSSEMRENPLFMRNSYQGCGKWDIPLVRKQTVHSEDISLVAYSDTRSNDCAGNRKRGVHFFVDDYRFEGIYTNPDRSLPKLIQYAFLLTPDFSLYADMPMWKQLENVARNRWVGAYWQEHGIIVVPTISRGSAQTYNFCFDGVEQGAVVAIGMIGCKSSRTAFMRGYDAMLERLQPEKIIVFGTPFPEMKGNIVPIDYLASRKVVR